jgi:hypothetical protein
MLQLPPPWPATRVAAAAPRARTRRERAHATCCVAPALPTTPRLRVLLETPRLLIIGVGTRAS